VEERLSDIETRAGVRPPRRGVWISISPKLAPFALGPEPRLLPEWFTYLKFAQQHLAGLARTVADAEPGDYLNVPDIALTVRPQPTRLASGAVWLHGAVDDATAGRVLVGLTGPARYLAGPWRAWRAVAPLRALPFPSSRPEVEELIRAVAADEGVPTPSGDPAQGSPAAITALAQRLSPLAAATTTPCLDHNVMARVLVREPGTPPVDTIIIGVPLWVGTKQAKGPVAKRRH
jgi:hypothetical protein